MDESSARAARCKNFFANSVSEAATQCSVACSARRRHVLACRRQCAGNEARIFGVQALRLGSFVIGTPRLASEKPYQRGFAANVSCITELSISRAQK
jgi:hypothetical protein